MNRAAGETSGGCDRRKSINSFYTTKDRELKSYGMGGAPLQKLFCWPVARYKRRNSQNTEQNKRPSRTWPWPLHLHPAITSACGEVCSEKQSAQHIVGMQYYCL